MTEPVAYRVDGTLYNNLNDAEDAVIEINHLRKVINIDNGSIPRPIYIEPLYEEIKLHPRVKMTQAEFDEWQIIMKQLPNSPYTFLSIIYSNLDTFKNLYNRLFDLCGNSNPKFQVELSNLYMSYRTDNPAETIEIVPNMKWFVEKKKFNGDYKFLKINEKDLHYNHLKEQATQFDTKEEAEKWTNPLTEAVQLPVEVK